MDRAALPGAADEYERVFGCPVLFDQRGVSMLVPLDVFKLPILAPNGILLERFEEWARSYLDELDDANPTTRAVTTVILGRLDDPGLSLGSVARELGLGARTLQNRLDDEGVKFSQLLGSTKERLARKYLAEGKHVDEIAYMLGFSDPSALSKAFRRWTGTSPSQFRVASPSNAESAWFCPLPAGPPSFSVIYWGDGGHGSAFRPHRSPA